MVGELGDQILEGLPQTGLPFDEREKLRRLREMQGWDVSDGVSLAETSEEYRHAREVLANEGFTFVVAIQAVSIGQLCKEETSTAKYFEQVIDSPTMRALVPSPVELAFDPRKPYISGSDGRKPPIKKAMVEQWGEDLRQKTGLQVLVRVPHASELAQADIFCRQQHGVKLLGDFFALTADMTFAYKSVRNEDGSSRFSVEPDGPCVAYIGRTDRDHGLRIIDDFYSSGGPGLSRAVAGVELPPRKR